MMAAMVKVVMVIKVVMVVVMVVVCATGAGTSGGDAGTARPQGVTGGVVTGPGGGGGVTGPGVGGGVTGGGVTGGGVTGGGITGGGVMGGGVTGPVTAARRVRLVGAGGPCEGLVQMRHGERWDAVRPRHSPRHWTSLDPNTGPHLYPKHQL
ncbi:uncharacterized protein LOC133345441 [Lethenteron reissneri]|uniref:uncharacterized protein LOC133345441 n=1 Tax=Lethenteron reissneri TaxID=7753 RepID=UPI002AB6CDD7|nr:uncharacterized protein LOC133345441 [Lethenteron reissneri]